jgi:hypothetical protein
MTSTASDLVRGTVELTDGTSRSPELQAQRLHARKFTGVDIGYGYGLGVMSTKDMYGLGELFPDQVTLPTGR